MKILIVTPADPRSRLGNAVTAQRYGAFLRSSKWGVRVARAYRGEDADVLVALHARKSASAVLGFRRAHPDRPIIVVLTGTDLYRDLPTSVRARQALGAATAIVSLQSLGLRSVPASLREKAISIIQSAPTMRRNQRIAPRAGRLNACVIGHLREEKDPMRAAVAARSLPPSVDVRVYQAGKALAGRYAVAAEKEMRRNPRYRWLGELSQAGARRLLRSSDVMVISSLMEGGANVMSEAIACGVPILASRIDGNIGILGLKYPGYFPARDTKALARLLRRAADERAYLHLLRRHVQRLRPLVSPARERCSWISLVAKLTCEKPRVSCEDAHQASRANLQPVR